MVARSERTWPWTRGVVSDPELIQLAAWKVASQVLALHIFKLSAETPLTGWYSCVEEKKKVRIGLLLAEILLYPSPSESVAVVDSCSDALAEAFKFA